MPSFAIEVPGEANPLTEHTLLQTLQSASSHDNHQLQTSTKQLREWEKAPGYYRHLQSVFIDRSLPLELRYLAVIQLKNGIDKYWRKTATNAVNKEDKAVIRSRLLESGINEPDERLALQNALVVAKVIRFEFPNDWPDAISSIIDLLRSSAGPGTDLMRLPRTLLILLHITKELATARIQRMRQGLQAVTPEIVSVLGQIYVDRVRTWQNALDSNTGDAESLQYTLHTSLLALKVLRRLLIHGYEFPNREPELHQFWEMTANHVGAFLGIVSAMGPSLPREITALVEKHLLQLAKLHVEMARTHPTAFVLLPNSLKLVGDYWALVKQFGENFGSKTAVTNAETGAMESGQDKDYMEKLSLRGLLLVRACIKMVHNPTQTFKYRHAQEKEEKAQASQTMKENLLTRPFVEEVMTITIEKFFVFREKDLQEWEDDAEDWEQAMEGEAEGYEFSIRPCAEKLFLDVALNYRDILVEPLIMLFTRVATPENEDILLKDSVYTAVGLAAAVLHQQLDFNAFLSTTLVAEVQKQKPGFNILRRRIAILLGQWITIKVSQQNRPLVYTIFQHLLNPDDPMNDQVVRITAGRQFKNIVDDWEFTAEQFTPFADSILTRLMELISEVGSTETKMALLNSVSILVERLERHVTPYADRIVNLLPPLWEQSAEEHLMKQAILTILSRLVSSMKAESVPYHALMLPIIRGAVEPESETQIYLLDDAMDLWAAILAQTPAPASPELIALAPYLFGIFEYGSENLRKALEIAESYLLLAASDMLADSIRKPLIASLASIIGDLKPDANGLVNNLVETIIRAADGIAGESAVQAVTSDLIESGFLGKQLKGLRGSWVAHCTTGPTAKEPPVDGIVETDYFSVLARLLLASVPVFLQAVQYTATSPDVDLGTTSLDATMHWLLEEWFSHFENVGDPARRKLMCLALTKLLDSAPVAPVGLALTHLQSLMTVWTSVVVELCEDYDGDVPDGDSLLFSAQTQYQLDVDQQLQLGEGFVESAEDVRRRLLSQADHVHTVPLKQWIRHYLQGAVAAAGGQESFQQEWLVNVDKDVVAEFGKLGVL